MSRLLLAMLALTADVDYGSPTAGGRCLSSSSSSSAPACRLLAARAALHPHGLTPHAWQATPSAALSRASEWLLASPPASHRYHNGGSRHGDARGRLSAAWPTAWPATAAFVAACAPPCRPLRRSPLERFSSLRARLWPLPRPSECPRGRHDSALCLRRRRASSGVNGGSAGRVVRARVWPCNAGPTAGR